MKNINLACDLISENKFEEAKSILEEIIKEEPQNKEAIKNLGLCQINLGEWDGAKITFEKATIIDPDDATSWFYLASSAEKISEISIAIEGYKKVISLRPEFYDAIKNLSVLYLTENSPELAIELLEGIISQSNEDYQLYYLLATAQISTGQEEAGIKNLEKAHEIEPNNVQIINNIGSCYLGQNNQEKALEYFNKAYDLDSENPLTNYNLALIFDNKGEYKRALNYYGSAYKKQPSGIILNTYANCAIKAEDYHLAKSLYSMLVSLNPQQIKYQKNLMLSLENTGDYKNALIIAKKLSQHDPKDVDILRKLAYLHRQVGEFNEAIDILNFFVKKGQIESDIYWELGLNYLNLDEKELAQTSFRKGLKLDPNNPYLKRDLALLYLRMGQLDWAQDEMYEALKIEPDSAELKYSMGVIYFELNQLEDAYKYLNEIKEDFSTDNIFLSYFGQILLKMGNKKEGIETFKNALKINPRCEISLYELAKYYLESKKYNLAENMAQELLLIKKDNEYMYLSAKIDIAKENWSKAKNTLSEIAQNHPNNHIIAYELAKCCFELGDMENAKKYAQNALEIYPDFQDALNIIKKLEKNND